MSEEQLGCGCPMCQAFYGLTKGRRESTGAYMTRLMLAAHALGAHHERERLKALGPVLREAIEAAERGGA